MRSRICELPRRRGNAESRYHWIPARLCRFRFHGRTRIARLAAALSALALVAFVALGSMSIGLYYFPATVAVIIAVFGPRPPDQLSPIPKHDQEFWSQKS